MASKRPTKKHSSSKRATRSQPANRNESDQSLQRSAFEARITADRVKHILDAFESGRDAVAALAHMFETVDVPGQHSRIVSDGLVELCRRIKTRHKGDWKGGIVKYYLRPILRYPSDADTKWLADFIVGLFRANQIGLFDALHELTTLAKHGSHSLRYAIDGSVTIGRIVEAKAERNDKHEQIVNNVKSQFRQIGVILSEAKSIENEIHDNIWAIREKMRADLGSISVKSENQTAIEHDFECALTRSIAECEEVLQKRVFELIRQIDKRLGSIVATACDTN